MNKKTTNNGILGPKALEMVMKDVLSGMEEFAVMNAYEASNEKYKIIAIRPQILWPSQEACNEFSEQQLAKNNNKPLAEVIIFDEYLKSMKRIKP